jgi:crotonobetainyl-CoA:carnitine CoA-transferase CaiB-like acyl-CoA transferase
MKGPLTGIRVLALENYLAGPVASMTMGDLGAEVIKIEPPQGDLSRQTMGPNHKGESSHYLSWNRNKKGIILDLRTTRGKEAFYDLVKISDVVLNNFRAGVMARLKADHALLNKINPRIISVNLTGMGPFGPYRDRPSVESTAAGISGILSVTGEPGGRPVRPGPAMSDLANAQYAVIATLSALLERERTGVGQNVDVSLLGASVAYMGYHISYYTCSGIVPEPLGSGYPFTAPYGAYKTADGYVVLGPCWPRIARAIGAGWLIDDPRFATAEARLAHRHELDIEIEKCLAAAGTSDWLNIFYAEDIVAGPLQKVDEVVADPQVNAIKMILDIPHPLGGSIKAAGNPIMMESLDGANTAPPTLGQDTEDVFRTLLHYSQHKIQALKAEQEKTSEETRSHVWKEK